MKRIEERVEFLERRVLLLESLLREFFPLTIEKLLEKRGFEIAGSGRDIEIENRDRLYEYLKSYHFRRILHDALFLKQINSEKIALLKRKWGEKTEDYLNALSSFRIVSIEDGVYKANFSVSFAGVLFEWLIWKYLSEELNLEALLNVRIRGIKHGGDTDVAARFGTKLIAVECKESPPNNIPVSELKSIDERIEILKPDIFLFAIDTTLSIERNIIDNLKWILKVNPKKVREGVYMANKYFFVVTAKRDVLQNIKFAIFEGLNGIR